MRIAVVGNASGSGKTTVGRRLAEVLGVPLVELDALFHGPGWTANSDFEARLQQAMVPSRWVTDGNYFDRGGEACLRRADLVVWLDIPLRVCLWRLAHRTVWRYLTREELWNGNRQKLGHALLARDGLLRFAIAAHGPRRREMPRRLAGTNHVRVRTQREIDALVAELASGEPASRRRGA